MIDFDKVTKRYADGTTAVDELSLSVPAGGITVLVGPSGCGKTTSLRMINRMVDPTSGRILLDGRDVAQVPPAQLRRSIGYVIQQAGLFPHRTVLANVMVVPRLLGWDRAKARAAAHLAIEKVGLTSQQAQRYPAQLSGGQQQRVGVARALASGPDLMLMDEPFSAVDPLVRVDLQAELRRLQRELGITVVLVTHDIDEALTLGDTIAVLRQGGRLAQIADPDTLLAAPADDFVAAFVGRDRGYRRLGFAAVDLEPTPEPAVLADEPVPGVDDWVLVVNEEGRPLGWRRGAGMRRHARVSDALSGTDVIQPEADAQIPVETVTEIESVGTLATTDSSARVLLDAALSSPSGRGIVVDADGIVVGTVRAQDVLAALGPSGPPPESSRKQP